MRTTGKRCAIMQPTYLPWAGYFHLMRNVDVFVLLDDAQFQYQSWHCRNRILVRGQEHMLTVPTVQQPLNTPLNAIETASHLPWKRKHWQTLAMAYNKAPHGKQTLGYLSAHYLRHQPTRLSTWNTELIKTLAGMLGINVPMVLASELGCEGKRSERLLNILARVGATHYVSPKGAENYLFEDDFQNNGKVELSFQSFTPPSYAQIHAQSFVSHLSVVDVLAHLGTSGASNYVNTTFACG